MTRNQPVASPRCRFQDDWERHIKCATSAMVTVTTDPFTVKELIDASARKLRYAVIYWDIARGFSTENIPDQTLFEQELERVASLVSGVSGAGASAVFNQPVNVLLAIPKLNVKAFYSSPNAVFCLANFYPYFESDEVRQEFEDQIKFNELQSQEVARSIHFVQVPYGSLGLRGLDSVQFHIESLPLDLPDVTEIRDTQVQMLVDTVTAESQIDRIIAPGTDLSEDHLAAISAACAGLPRHRVQSLLYFAAAKTGGIVPGLVSTVSALVAAELASVGPLEIVPESTIAPPEDLAGIDNALMALDSAAITYTEAAAAQGLDLAKGLWLCGNEGTGKSVCARTAAIVFERRTKRPWKVVRVRMSDVYGGLVGKTEQNWRDVEARLGAFNECICIFDEMDKVFGGISSRSGDSGVSQSLFGMWLAWMGDPERRGRVYPILAMNDPSMIPPEALRAGRLDAGFFFDLPTAPIRAEIAKIHFNRRLKRIGRTIADLEWQDSYWEDLGEATENYLPAEIETLVETARRLAFDPSEIRLPSFNQVMGLVQKRKQETASNEDSKQVQVSRMKHINDLRKKCQGMGAQAVYSSVPQPRNTTRANGGTRPRRLGLPTSEETSKQEE